MINGGVGGLRKIGFLHVVESWGQTNKYGQLNTNIYSVITVLCGGRRNTWI